MERWQGKMEMCLDSKVSPFVAFCLAQEDLSGNLDLRSYLIRNLQLKAHNFGKNAKTEIVVGLRPPESH